MNNQKEQSKPMSIDINTEWTWTKLVAKDDDTLLANWTEIWRIESNTTNSNACPFCGKRKVWWGDVIHKCEIKSRGGEDRRYS